MRKGRLPAVQESVAPRAPLALAALIVCVAAFVSGWIPLLGAVLGGAGIVLVVLAARRGLATKRTYAGAAAAALGVLASAAMTLALIVAVMAPADDPDPVAAAEEADGLDESSEEPGYTEAETESTAEDEQSGTPAGNATTPAASSTPSTEPEGTEEIGRAHV